MITVSVLPSKSQSISVSLSGQQCNIKLVQRQSFMYMDLTVNEVPIMQVDWPPESPDNQYHLNK